MRAHVGRLFLLAYISFSISIKKENIVIADFRKKSAFIGIAVHDDRISMAKLRQTKKKIVVEGFSIIPLPAGTIIAGKVNQAPLLWQTLKEWAQLNHAKRCFAALALPASQVIHKRIRVAACLNDFECEAEIAANLAQYLPGINEPLHFDFLPIKRDGQEVELQLIAARSEQVTMYCHAAYTAGIKVKSVDVDAYAITRAVNFILPSMSSGIILDMDITTAQFILLKDRKILAIYPLVLETGELLWQQIQRTLHFLSVTESVGLSKKILLTGELRQLTNLANPLRDECGLIVETIDSLGEKLEITHDVTVSAGLTALGLALRGCLNA